MHVARITVILGLILAIVFTNNPYTREEVSQSWEHIRPDILHVMDGLYAAIRNFVAGPDSQDGFENTPDVDYERVITRNQATVSES